MKSWERIAFWFDLVLIGAIAALEVAYFSNILSESLFDIFIVVFSLAGLVPVLISAVRSLIRRRASIDLLASIALIAALMAREWHSVAFITLMLASARALSVYTQGQAERSIRALLKLRPSKVHIKTDGNVHDVPLERVRVGDIIIIESGERVPVDGVVQSGSGALDQSSLTGESEPVNKGIGDHVYSSTLNVGGSLEVRTMKVGEDTTFAKIVRLIQEAQKAKAPINTTADRFATGYVIAMVALAAGLYATTHNLALMLSVLLVVCADDLAIGIPLAITATVGAAAHRGVIIKGGAFVEGLAKVGVLITDKTGTITEGKLAVQNVTPLDDATRERVLALTGALESISQHPTARAVTAYARNQGVVLPKVEQIHEEPGYGISGSVDGTMYHAGNAKFIEGSGIPLSASSREHIESEKSHGYSVVVLANGRAVLGFVSLSDAIRSGVANVMDDIRSLGVNRIVMLTGDNERVAERIAGEARITEVHANLLPEHKMEFIRHARNPHHTVVMIGDGVNDAAALSIADIGVAMGGIGSDATIDSADIVLMRDDIHAFPRMIRLSRYAMRVIRQDIGIWIASNIVGLVLVFSGVIGPTGAAAYNFLTDFLPLVNSLKLYRLHLTKGTYIA